MDSDTQINKYMFHEAANRFVSYTVFDM